MEKFRGIIYQAINIQNNKSYIGKTIQDFEEYKQDHINNALEKKDLKQIKSGKHFYNAIRKYGEQNFKWIILGEIFAESKQELKKLLNEAEKESIWIFRTFGVDGVKRDSIYGYNSTKGGDGGNTLEDHPNKEEIYKKSISKRIETEKNKTEEEKNKKRNKIKQIHIDNPIIDQQISKKQKIIWKNRTEQEKIDIRSKINFKKKLNKSIIGVNHPRYKYLHYTFLIDKYFEFKTAKEIIKIYNNEFKDNIKERHLIRFLSILNFPYPFTLYNNLKDIYYSFIKDNKNNINYYKKLYLSLEEEYYNKSCSDRDIKINSKIKEKETLLHRTEEEKQNIIKKSNEKKKHKTEEDKEISYNKRITTLQNIPEDIKIERKQNRKKTIENRTKEEKTIISFNLSQGQLNRKEEDKKISSLKQKQTKLLNKTACGKNNSKYIKLDYTLLLHLYFSQISFLDMHITYIKETYSKLSIIPLRNFLKILNFPINTLANNRKKQRDIYLKFVEENKHEINWFIENYERLEEEYFEKLYQEKYKEFLITNN